MTATTTRIFVYGTLMRGHCRHFVLHGQQFLGEGLTLPLYKMVNCGEYPGLIEADSGIAVYGEVWEVARECLLHLDEVEGTDEQLYLRRTVYLQSPFDDVHSEAYFYARSPSGLPDCGDRWT